MSSSQTNTNKWNELKHILLEEESIRISTLEGKVLHPEDFAKSMAEVLADAVQGTEDKARLSQKLYPVVEESIYKSVQKNPESLADAIYPVITPAIRKAINEALKKVTESVNSTVNEGLTARSMKWRMQALFSKKSYGELVLQYSLLYQVQEIYLIHNETGLLISHVSQKTGDNPDGDMISGMLTAIKDFVSDSFHTDGALNRIEVGELSVIMNQGPHATLAAVVKGDPSMQFNTELNDALEKIHQEFGKDLDQFDGKTDSLQDTSLLIEPFLVTELDHSGSPSGSGKMKIIAAIPILALLLWIGFMVYFKIETIRLNHRLKENHYEVIMSNRNWKHYRLIVQDQFQPKDDQPTQTAAALVAEFEKHSWLETDLVTFRSPIRKVLQVIGSDTSRVALSYHDQTISLKGQLPNKRIQRLASMLPIIADNHLVDLSELVPEEYGRIMDLKNELDGYHILFQKGSTRLVDDQIDKIMHLNDILREINDYCRELEEYWQLFVFGTTTDKALTSRDIEIDNNRALFVVDQLIDKQLEFLYVKWIEADQLQPDTSQIVDQPEDYDQVSFELKRVE